ncbi:MAG: hypothetical protein EOP52_07595 [Sphingobacteriales bacterium]|nr:MAG: hypothetical protein EOP52_07595 [Sphingobacteriales bacterium]
MGTLNRYLIIWQQVDSKNHQILHSGMDVIAAKNQEKAKRLYRHQHPHHEVLRVVSRTASCDQQPHSDAQGSERFN